MKLLLLTSLLVGYSLADVELAPGGGNYVRVEKGRVVEYNHASSLRQSMMRSAGEGSTQDDNVFNGQISISDALNPDSPFSTWVDDLLNPESDPYKQAVINALKILLAILIAALAPLGITDFSVLILGFAPGSVQVNYELAVDSADYSANNSPPAEDIATSIVETIDNSGGEITDPVTGESLATLDSTETVLDGGDGTSLSSSCPACWTVSQGQCVPDPDHLVLSCNWDGMSLQVDHCVMGNTDLASLQLNGGCDADSGAIVDENGDFIATTALDGCSSSMSFDASAVTFSNRLEGTFQGDGIISSNDRYSVDFECSYATTYDDISASTDVSASINSGPTDGIGQLSFVLNTYTDNTFATPDIDNTVVVGTTLYFGVEISQEISGLEFTVTDCTVYSAADASDPATLEYGILTGSCPNNRVLFKSIVATDTALTQFSYTVFEFKDSEASTLHLSCNIVVCDAADADSTCNATPSCGSRRKRRSLDEGVTYYRVSRDFVAV
jgi:hypothetical protein